MSDRPASPSYVAAGGIVTPANLNSYPQWSQEIQDAWDREHSPADQEHADLRIPIAAGIIEMSAGTYSVGANKNVKSVTKNGTGDITITFDLNTENATDYAVLATPILAGEPFIVKEYDDGATRNATGAKTRLLICDQTKTAKNVALYVRLFGRRSGSGTAAGAAVNDVRQRIAVDGPETAEHRRLLREFADYWSAAVERKHRHAIRGFGAHWDIMVPSAVAIVRAPPNSLINSGPGTLVWQAGFEFIRYESMFGLPAGGLQLPHQIAFRVEANERHQVSKEFAWLGASATITQDAATLRSDACVMPRFKKNMRGGNWDLARREGVAELGDAAGLADSTSALVVVCAYAVRRNP